MRLFSILILCFTCVCSFSSTALSADAEKNYKLIFSTFDNTSAKNYAYLRDSIQTMLMSRLSANEKIEVVDKVLSKKELAALAESRTEATFSSEADYLVTGSIYALASGINVQVAMYPFDSGGKVLNFSQLSTSAEEIIAGNDTLIREVLIELFGEEDVSGEAESIEGAVAGFKTAHPEAEYKKGLYSGTFVDSDPDGIQAKASGVKRTLDISGEILACTVGDLNGDGIDEIITLTSSAIKIYQTRERKIVEVDSTKLPGGTRGHGLTVADIDGDGKCEIYLSATDGLFVASRILGWSGKGGFTTLAKNIRWYIRPIKNTDGVWKLAGQKRGRAKTDFLAKGIYWLNIDSAFVISEGKKIAIPANVNLFDFAFAELDGEKGDELVVLDSNEKLRVISNDNELLWVSSANFGGSKIYIGPSQGSAVDKQSRTNLSVDEDAERELIFVPARILVTDVDGNGLSEIVVNKNKSGQLGWFKRLRSYDSGTVVGLAWNGEGLVEVWRTGRYKGHVVDYYLKTTGDRQSVSTSADSTRISTGQLYVANLPLSGSFVGLIPGMSDTKIALYELDFYKQKQVDKNE